LWGHKSHPVTPTPRRGYKMLRECNNSSKLIKSFDLESVSQLLDLLKNPEVQTFLKLLFDCHLATSDLQVLKRLAKIESVLGLNDIEPDQITIPKQIEAIKEEMQNIEYKSPVSLQVELKPDTKTGMRALHLITRLKDSGKKHLTHNEIKSILSELPEDCKIDPTCKNPRKTIIDILHETVSMCSDVFLDQKKTGHKEWRIVLKS
jgi:hypothetical protein